MFVNIGLRIRAINPIHTTRLLICTNMHDNKAECSNSMVIQP